MPRTKFIDNVALRNCETETGMAFVTYEQALKAYWQADCDEDITEVRLARLEMTLNETRDNLLRLIHV